MKRIVMALPLLLGACLLHVGTHPRNYPPAKRAAGTSAAITTTRGMELAGELLEVRDTAFLVVTTSQVVLVRFNGISRATFADMPGGFRLPLPAADRERLRLLSRFPQGIPAGTLNDLVRGHGQTRVVVIEP